MRKTFYILLTFLTLSTIVVNAQSLKFVRKDVDSSRSKFVTATYLFSIDIIAENVEKCTNVAFELRFNKTRFIKFSEWERGSFGPTTKTYVIPLVDIGTDVGRIIVSSGMDYTRDTNAPNSPKVVNLKFVVIPAAPHFDVVTFNLINPRLTVIKDGRQQLIDLPNSNISYTIHSYVNVWPGDANNDGIVDHLDFATVSYYLGLGPNTKQMRSFKREPSSTLWAPQPVIAWDTAAATYADCDGNGEVNMVDNLVISYNYDKRHPVGGIINSQYEIELPKIHINKTSRSIVLPIYVNTFQRFLSLAGSVQVPNLKNYDVLGIEPAGLLEMNKATFATWKVNDKNIDFSVGTVDKANVIEQSGVVANLVLEPKDLTNERPVVQFQNLKAITIDGNIFDLYAYTSVETQSKNNQIVLIYDKILDLNGLYGSIDLVEVYNLQGELVYKLNNPQQQIVNLSCMNIANGLYFVKIVTKEETKYLKILIQ